MLRASKSTFGFRYAKGLNEHTLEIWLAEWNQSCLKYPTAYALTYGADHLEYIPDFVAETADVIFMLEPKASNRMEDPIVLAKKEAALKWCAHASDHAQNHGGKPWRYVLIPHNAISVSLTLEALVSRFGC